MLNGNVLNSVKEIEACPSGGILEMKKKKIYSKKKN